MIKYVISFVVLVQMVYGQDMNDYNPEVVSECKKIIFQLWITLLRKEKVKLNQNTECYINIDFCIFTQVTTSTIMVIHANDFAQLNALKIKSNVAKNKLQQAAYKTISAFTKDLIGITLSFVTDFAQSNVKMMKWNAQ